jgi:hypothetical protein
VYARNSKKEYEGHVVGQVALIAEARTKAADEISRETGGI